MAFVSLAERLDQLPIIIAGPILRRVEAHSVSVWIACRKKIASITLEVKNISGDTVLETTGSTIALGKNLHVALVTVTTMEEALKSDTIYLYDMVLDGQALSSPGILAKTAKAFTQKFCYKPFPLPSFSLPPSDINNLKIVHASCRKPHGGVPGEDTDALRALDSMLEATAPHDHKVEGKRPQLLLLTGDQIYADDVADVLLFLIQDAADTILGWDELLPVDTTQDDLRPGNRLKLIAPIAPKNQSGTLSSVEGKSHLITLGEFYTMYLFAWSDVLWPSQLPSYKETYQMTEDQIEGAAEAEKLLKDPLTLKKLDTVSKLKPIMEFIKKLQETNTKVTHFQKSLSFIRKVFANIPSYMILDDHEITDDLFITRRWTEYALAKDSVSRRIIQNGLAAYAVFQAWGNTPLLFSEGTKGHKLLNSLSDLNEIGKQFSHLSKIGELILPTLSQEIDGYFKLENKIPLHFTIDYSGFRLIVLDIRTQRSFSKEEGPPALIHPNLLEKQLGIEVGQTLSNKLSFVVSAVPVFSSILLDKLKLAVPSPFGWKRTWLANKADKEAWSFDVHTFEGLLLNFAKLGHVVIISGDVHYSFSITIQYWDERKKGDDVAFASFAQVCSSGAKNAWDGFIRRILNSLNWAFLIGNRPIDFVGWENPDKARLIIRGDGKQYSIVGKETPAVIEIPYHHVSWRVEEVSSSIPPDWRYRMMFSMDTNHTKDKKKLNRGLVDYPSLPSNAQERSGKIHQRAKDFDDNFKVVATDNIGVVTLEWNTTTKRVTHELWYVVKPGKETDSEGDSYQLFPYTTHILDLHIDKNTSRPLEN